MSSSAAGSTNGDAGDGTDDLPVTLERTVERLDQGIVVTYELTAEADESVELDLRQAFPPELAVADVGFRTDAAPAEWHVDEDTVHGSGMVPEDDSVEYVLGLKLPESPDRVPTFPEAELVAPDDMADTEIPDGDASPTEPSDIDLGPEAEAASEGATEAATGEDGDEGPELVGNTDGALAESVRQVIGGDSDEESEAADDAGGMGDAAGETEDASDGEADAASDEAPGTGAAATDGGPGAVETETSADDAPAPRENPDDDDTGLEAAIAAVESDLDDEESALAASNGTDDAEQPELDLSVPEVNGPVGDVSTEEPTENTTDASAPVSATDGGTETTSPVADAPGDEASETSTGATVASEPAIGSLADRLAAADETERRAVRDALGVDDGTGMDDHGGTTTVRLEKLESRLSAFEAYEDALAEFIEDTGTVETVEETATEAAEAADELRTEVADLRAEVTAAREAVEEANEERAALHETVEEATEERAALRDDVNTLREEVDEALGLRQQLLGALTDAGSATDAPDAAAETDE